METLFTRRHRRLVEDRFWAQLSLDQHHCLDPEQQLQEDLSVFPAKMQVLLNTYTFMRAGTSLLKLDDVWSTNPLFLTNREAALSEVGEEEVRRACNLLKASGITPTVVRYSLAASCIDTANIVGEELKIGRDRLVPEFNYLDPRAIGGK